MSGGGFIAFDEADARYLGALGLSVGDISIGAVGVLDTRLPDGTKGYSLVVVAAATFPPVQLGFGFSLDGLGLLIGVNRTMDVPSLQALARAGHLDDLMFPADLADRAPQVAANLAAEFPAAQGHFVIGPAVQLQWGADGLVDIEVGVLIELSDAGGGISLLRVALLGFVHRAAVGQRRQRDQACHGQWRRRYHGRQRSDADVRHGDARQRHAHRQLQQCRDDPDHIRRRDIQRRHNRRRHRRS